MDSDHPSTGRKKSFTDGVWDDTGDELRPTRPCSPTSGITIRENPLTTQPPGPDCQEICCRTEPERSARRDDPAPVLHSATHGGFHRHIRKTFKSHDERSFSPHHKQYQAFPPDASPVDYGSGAARQLSRWLFQKSAPANWEHEKGLVGERSSSAEYSDAGRFLGARQACNSLREKYQGAAVIQGYCNWLLAGKVAQVR